MNDFGKLLSRELPRPKKEKDGPLVFDLFAGCGGLALGFEAAGFTTIGFEMVPDFCNTYARNLRRECHEATLSSDTEFDSRPDVIIGGPPCQPFSVIGNQNGHRDSRDGFPAFISAVRRCKPKMFLFENVRGMLYRNVEYFRNIVDQLQDLGYSIDADLLNAVHYGVPQRRERLIVVGHNHEWHYPPKRQPAEYVTAGSALGDMAHEVPPDAKFLTESMDHYVAVYEEKSKCIRPRDLHLDQPSRTVTCRNLQAATSDMLRVVLPDGRRRLLTVREGARLQSFPDWFEFSGNKLSQYDQVGNAVPPLMAKAIAMEVMRCLCQGEKKNSRKDRRRNGQFILELRA